MRVHVVEPDGAVVVVGAAVVVGAVVVEVVVAGTVVVGVVVAGAVVAGVVVVVVPVDAGEVVLDEEFEGNSSTMNVSIRVAHPKDVSAPNAPSQ